MNKITLMLAFVFGLSAFASAAPSEEILNKSWKQPDYIPVPLKK
jgi:hypothetical protein